MWLYVISTHIIYIVYSCTVCVCVWVCVHEPHSVFRSDAHTKPSRGSHKRPRTQTHTKTHTHTHIDTYIYITWSRQSNKTIDGIHTDGVMSKTHAHIVRTGPNEPSIAWGRYMYIICIRGNPMTARPRRAIAMAAIYTRIYICIKYPRITLFFNIRVFIYNIYIILLLYVIDLRLPGPRRTPAACRTVWRARRPRWSTRCRRSDNCPSTPSPAASCTRDRPRASSVTRARILPRTPTPLRNDCI